MFKVCGLALVTVSIAFCDLGYTNRGSMEIGGAIGYTSAFYSNYNVNLFMLAPLFKAFLADHLFLGPTINFEFQHEKDDLSEMSATIQSYGPTIGGEFKTVNFLAMSFGLSPQLAITTDSYTDFSGSGYGVPATQSDNHTGFIFSAFLGVKFILNEHVGLNIQPTYSYSDIDGEHVNQLIVQFSVTGLIFWQPANVAQKEGGF